MEKAPDAFRTISEVAGELDLPQHVLRFWETRFAQIKPLAIPMHRPTGRFPFGGRLFPLGGGGLNLSKGLLFSLV